MISNTYKYDEFGYADLIVTKGFQTKHIYTELCLLVLYYRDVCKLKPKEIKKELKRFCKEHIDNYNYASYFKIINKAFKYTSKKMTLVSVPYVDIYDGEIGYIESLNIGHEYKKLLFTFLVYMKLDNKYRELKYGKPSDNVIFRGGAQKYNQIKHMAKLNQSLNVNTDAIPLLASLNEIKILYSGKIALEFIPKCIEDGSIAIRVYNYDNIGWYYDYYCGVSKIALCKECGQPYRRNSNKHMYCKECGIALHLRNMSEHRYNQYSICNK